MSYGDRLILVNSVLTSLPMFMLSFLQIPKGVRKRLDVFRSRFFGKVMNKRENTDLLNGTSYVNLRIRGFRSGGVGHQEHLFTKQMAF